jgi:hypothetical protein
MVINKNNININNKHFARLVARYPSKLLQTTSKLLNTTEN